MAIRDQGLIQPKFQGVRTKKLKQILEQRLALLGRTGAEGKIITALSAAGLKLGDDGRTQFLLFLGDAEIAAFAELIDQHWDELEDAAPSDGKKSKKEAKASAPPEVVKKAKILLDGGKAVDVALFGRMLADLPEVNQDAACQVAHAISTHRVEREFDYFTAVDDQSGPDEIGAAMIGQVEFNSATFYRYAVIDAHKLLKNLHWDKDLTILAVEAFVFSAVRAIPTGKQNTFAAQNLPSFVGIVIRHDGPLNLANAFEKPITARQDEALTTLSVEALTSYESQLATAYANDGDTWGFLDLTGSWPKDKGIAHANLTELSVWVAEQIAQQLEV